MEKVITGEKWILKDTGIVRLPRNEKFVSFMKIKRKLFVLSNKAVYQLKLKTRK